jgi:prepilin-type N-terminal cleavage/methylation domain-containing protein
MEIIRKFYKRCRGFTIIELMVAMVIGSILAITAGSMLYYIFLTWHRNTDEVELQRDATIAMNMISRAIRAATANDIQAASQSLVIKNKTFYNTNSSLWYDPDTTIANNEIEIINNKVNSISFINNAPEHSIGIDIELQDGVKSTAVSSTISYRN